MSVCLYVCVPVSVFAAVFCVMSFVHLSVKCAIGSQFNLHEKIMGECNQMDCVFGLLCVPRMAEGQSVYLSARVNKTIAACVFVCIGLSVLN